MQLLPDPGNEMSVIKHATDNYLSLLEGFIFATEGKANQPEGDGQVSQQEDDIAIVSAQNAGPSSGLTDNSKLRNVFRVKWSNTLISKLTDQSDMVVEKINILFNVALWHTKHAAKLAGSKEEVSENEAKEVHRTLRIAAGIFQYIQDNPVQQLTEESVPVSDMDNRILKAYTLQCTAEAQEVTLARAIELNHSASLISALAHETARLFQNAMESIKTIEDNGIAKWRSYFNLKFAFYMSYAHCYNGNVLLEKEKCGEAIRSLKESVSLYEKSRLLCAEYAKAVGSGTIAKPEQHLFFRKFGMQVMRTLEKVERENGFIFYQQVPEEIPELELKATYGLASPQIFESPVKNSKWTPELYNGFNISDNSAPAQNDEPVKPVKEKDIKSTEKEPSNKSGCLIS